MSHTATYQPGGMAKLARNPFVIAPVTAVHVAFQQPRFWRWSRRSRSPLSVRKTRGGVLSTRSPGRPF